MTDDASGIDRSDEPTLIPDPDAPTVTPSGLPTADAGHFPPPDRPLPDRIGHYRILGPLGEGGMGVVYEAEQRTPRRRVALKVIRGGAFVDDAALRMFQREADTLGRLKHPHIAAIYESGRTEDGQHFFAMELVRGDTLSGYLRSRPEALTPLELRHRLALFRQIADAVHYAHQRGVIHRDLKPGNIIVTEATASSARNLSGVPLPAVKVLDFGLARITEGDVKMTMTTEIGVIKGTLPYMSPEQARGQSDAIDVRSDVYALGVILYEMLAGRLPYELEGGSVPEALRIICEKAPRSLHEGRKGAKTLDPDVETIIGKALEKEVDRRYASAAALAEDVERYLTSQPILARPPSTSYQLRKFAGRNRVLVGGVLATMAVLVVGIVGTSVGMVRAWNAEAEAREAAESERQQREIAEAERADAQIEFERAKAVADFLKYGFGFLNPREDAGAELTVREMLTRAAVDIPHIFDGRPGAEASVRAMVGDTIHSLRKFADAARQQETAIELMEAEIAKRPGFDRWDLSLVDTLYRRQVTGMMLGEGRSEKMFALRRKIYEASLRLAGEKSPELVDPLQRVVAMTEEKEAPDLDEWLEILDDISRIHDRLGPSADPQGLRATYVILAIANTHLSNVLGFDDGDAVWELARELTRDSPYTFPGEQAMLLWLLVSSGAETPERSLELSREHTEILARATPPTNWARAQAQIWLGDALRRLGRYREAEEVELPAYSIVVDALGPRGFNVSVLASRVMLLYDDWGQKDKLAAFQEKVMLSGSSGAMGVFLRARSVAPVDPAVCDAYVGDYELEPGFILSVTREDDHLTTQAAGQPKVEFFPSSENVFFQRNWNTELTFVRGDDGTVKVELSGDPVAMRYFLRSVTPVDPSIYDAYVGDYELRPELILSVTREDDRLMAEFTGQSKLEIFPASENEFFPMGAEGEDWMVTFVRGEDGAVNELVVHQRTRHYPAKRRATGA